MTIKKALERIPDFRQEGKVKYNQADILFITICAILCGNTYYRDIATFTRGCYKWFKRELNLNWYKIPAYTTFRNILINIDTQELENVFREHGRYLLEYVSKNKGLDIDEDFLRQIAVDGKAIRGANNLQILIQFATEEKIILGHSPIRNEEKTNEIPKVQEEFRKMSLKEDTLFTLDAMHTQKETLSIIDRMNTASSDIQVGILTQVKNNQKGLSRSIQKRCNVKQRYDTYEDHSATHGRNIYRKVSVYHGGLLSSDARRILEWNAMVRDVIEVRHEKEDKLTSKTHIEKRYYTSTFSGKDAKFYAKHIRDHWAIENNCNWVRDTVFKEDDKHNKYGDFNLCILRSFALNILYANEKKGLRQSTHYNSCCKDHMECYVGLFK